MAGLGASAHLLPLNQDGIPHPYSHRLKNGAVLVAPFWSFVLVVREVVHGNKSTRFKTQIITTFVNMKLSALCLAGFAAGTFGKCISNKPCSGKCVSAVGEVGEAFCSSYLSLEPATETVTQTATVTAVQTHLETSFEVVTLTTLTTTMYAPSPSHAHASNLAANAEVLAPVPPQPSTPSVRNPRRTRPPRFSPSAATPRRASAAPAAASCPRRRP